MPSFVLLNQNTTSVSFTYFIHNMNQSNYFQDHCHFILLIQDHDTSNGSNIPTK